MMSTINHKLTKLVIKHKLLFILIQCVYNKPLLTSNNHNLGNSPNDVKPLNNVNGPLMG